MRIEFEIVKREVHTFDLDDTETSKFLRWQLEQDGLEEKEIFNYLQQRDLNRQVIHFQSEYENMISVDDDDDE
jgi:hypothetical protein